jgi:hypothetical protein
VYPVLALSLTAGERIPSKISLSTRQQRLAEIIDDVCSIWDLPLVEQWATERNVNTHHVKVIYRVAMKSRHTSQDDFLQRLIDSGIPKLEAVDLALKFQLCTSNIVDTQVSSDECKKLVIKLSDGLLVETVLIRHDTSKATRYTVCVSSQVSEQHLCDNDRSVLFIVCTKRILSRQVVPEPVDSAILAS